MNNHTFLEYSGYDFESISVLSMWDYKIEIDADTKGNFAGALDIPKETGIVKEICHFDLPNKSK